MKLHLKITSTMLSAVMCASILMAPVSAIADETEAPVETQTEVTEKEEPETKETQVPEEPKKEPETKESEQAGETEPAQPSEDAKEDKEAAEPEEKIPSDSASVSKKYAVIGSGTCGYHLTWSLDSNGTLTIKGSGRMDDYSYVNSSKAPPWFEHADKITKVVIDSGVSEIGYYAFYKCKKITKVIIPDTVTSIGDGAFEYCEQLTGITIPGGVTYIGNLAFCSSGLKSVTLPSGLEEIGGGTFSNCRSLTTVAIPKGVTSIGDCAFYGSGITSLNIPDGVTFIGEQTFSNCTKLTSITLPDSITHLDYGTFEHCSSLRNVKLPKDITYMLDGLFEGCTGLTSITIPKSVTEIGRGAFSDCPLLNDVYYDGTKSDWDKIKIGENNKGIQVPEIHLGDGTVIPSKKSDNTLTAKGKTAKVKYKKLRKKARTVSRAKVLTVSNAQGNVTYKLTGVKRGKSKKYKKYFKINSTTGNVTIKKKLKKGTYKVTCVVTAAGDSNYKAGTKTVTFTIKIK